MNWALEIQQENLRRLATPGALPDHPLLDDDRLTWFLLQGHARAYERMLSLKRLRNLRMDRGEYRVGSPLAPRLPQADAVLITQGHYRIGSRYEPFALDHELPPQAVELASFRIARRPVSNAEYLAFLRETGVDRHPAHGPDAETDRPEARIVKAPLGWRRDAAGAWYQMNLNGPSDLSPEQPVSGLDRHEAMAYAAWADSLGGEHTGAVLQHEYQWEVAARAGHLPSAGQVWEWCANPFHAYPGFTPFPDARLSQIGFDQKHGVLRGASLHTQRCLRRASYRFDLPPDSRTAFAGLRLVYPPDF